MSPPEGPLRVVSSDSLLETPHRSDPEPSATSSASPAPVRPPPRQPLTIELDYPIQAHGETVTRLTFRPAKVRELKEVDALGNHLNTDVIAGLIVRLAGIPPSSVDQIDAADFFHIANELAPFFRRPARSS